MPQGPDSASTQAVFIVDDDAGVRRALTRLFRSDGLNAEGFASPLAFLQRLPTLGSGCVVLDLNMPEMSGTELHDLMCERGIALPVVFLTAHGDIPTGVTSMKKGAADFLEKPVDDEVLLKTVRDAIARHAADRVMRQARQTTLERLSRLSSREREVLHHVIGGRLNKQIAADLNISLKTVKVHRGRVMEKMEYASVAELARACESAGIKPQ
jgi:FixJ family two-component response regulator